MFTPLRSVRTSFGSRRCESCDSHILPLVPSVSRHSVLRLTAPHPGGGRDLQERRQSPRALAQVLGLPGSTSLIRSARESICHPKGQGVPLMRSRQWTRESLMRAS